MSAAERALQAVRGKLSLAAPERGDFSGPWTSGRLQIGRQGRFPGRFHGSELGDWREPSEGRG